MVHNMTIFAVNTSSKCILRRIRNLEYTANTLPNYGFSERGNAEKSYQHLKNEGFGRLFRLNLPRCSGGGADDKKSRSSRANETKKTESINYRASSVVFIFTT